MKYFAEHASNRKSREANIFGQSIILSTLEFFAFITDEDYLCRKQNYKKGKEVIALKPFAFVSQHIRVIPYDQARVGSLILFTCATMLRRVLIGLFLKVL